MRAARARARNGRPPVPRRDRHPRRPPRHPPRHGDRRRRHARRRVALEQLLGLGCRVRRLRARERPAHRDGRARRLERRDPLDHHVPRDEPLDHQRHLRRLRHGGLEGGAPPRRSGDVHGALARRRGRRCSARRSVSSSCPATAWRWRARRRGLRAHASRCGSAAPRCTSRFIPSPVACPGT